MNSYKVTLFQVLKVGVMQGFVQILIAYIGRQGLPFLASDMVNKQWCGGKFCQSQVFSQFCTVYLDSARALDMARDVALQDGGRSIELENWIGKYIWQKVCLAIKEKSMFGNWVGDAPSWWCSIFQTRKHSRARK